MIKGKTHSTLLAKYIKINFLVIFFPVMIIGIIYCIWVQKDYVEQYLKTIEYSVNEKLWQVEARTKSFASIAQRISSEEDLTPYSLTNSTYAAVKRLKTFTAESIYFNDLIICLNNSDKVYTSNGVVDLNTFLDRTYRPAEGFSEAAYRELLHTKEYYGGTKDREYITSGIFQYSAMTYPLGRSGGSFYGTLVGIYENDWEDIFQTEIAQKDKRLVIVCTNSVEMVYTQVPGDVNTDFEESLAQLLLDWNKDTEYYEFDLEGVDYIGKIAHSDTNGWYLIDMVDKNAVSSGVLVLQLPILLAAFFCLLVLTFLLSILLSMYNYVPIRRLYGLLDRKKEAKGKDELLFLNEYIRELIEEQNNMEAQLDISRKMSRMDLIQRLLRGSLNIMNPTVKEQMDSVCLYLDKKYMAAIVLKSSKTGERNFHQEIRNILCHSKHERIYLTERIYKDYDALLVCVETEEEIEEFSDWLAEQLFEHEGRIQIGIGNIYSSAESLKYSLMEGIIAVEGRDEDIVFFSNLTDHRNGEFYRKPLENELKLKQLLVTGEAEKLEEVLDKLYKELMRIRLSHSDTVMVFLMNRIISFLFEDAISIDEGEKYLHFTTLEEFMGQLREFCGIELNSRLEQKVSQEDKRMQSIISFIDENYMHSEMSLVMVAEKFDMTGPYLSRIFKMAMGRNFIEYITEKRLELAAKLLVETNAPIGEIVERVGYSDAASFTRKFSRYFLMSPGSYRRKKKEK